MWIVRIALKRPYTFVVLALLILIAGPLTIARTPTDIFPNIDIPAVTIIWNYGGGLSAEEMSTRIVSIFERSLTTTVNDIEHIESQSLRGIAVVKVFFQPGAKIELAVAQVTAARRSRSCVSCRLAPSRLEHPLAWTTPRACRSCSSRCRGPRSPSSKVLNDIGLNFLAHPVRQRGRRAGSVSVRRQAVPDPGGPHAGRAPGAASVAVRRGQRHQCAESGPPWRARKKSAGRNTMSTSTQARRRSRN